MEEKIKTKSEMLLEMQQLADDIGSKKTEIELLLTILDVLEKKYFDLAELITKN